MLNSTRFLVEGCLWVQTNLSHSVSIPISCCETVRRRRVLLTCVTPVTRYHVSVVCYTPPDIGCLLLQVFQGMDVTNDRHIDLKEFQTFCTHLHPDYQTHIHLERAHTL